MNMAEELVEMFQKASSEVSFGRWYFIGAACVFYAGGVCDGRDRIYEG